MIVIGLDKFTEPDDQFSTLSMENSDVESF